MNLANNSEWQTHVEVALAEMKKDIKYLIKAIDEKEPCEKQNFKIDMEKIKASQRLDRKLIFFLLITYIPLIITILFMQK